MLSNKSKELLEVAMGDKSSADEITAAVDSGSNSQAAFVAPVSAPNATDLASAETLANANKVAINAIIASMIAAGQMAAS